jgi:hypothetical protein
LEREELGLVLDSKVFESLPEKNIYESVSYIYHTIKTTTDRHLSLFSRERLGEGTPLKL